MLHYDGSNSNDLDRVRVEAVSSVRNVTTWLQPRRVEQMNINDSGLTFYGRQAHQSALQQEGLSFSLYILQTDFRYSWIRYSGV